jgi:hypothetical protein
VSCYKKRSRTLKTCRERTRNNFTNIIHSAVCVIFIALFIKALSTTWKSHRIDNVNSLIRIQKLNFKVHPPPSCLPGEDSPVSCEEVAGNAPETIWTLSRRDLMPPSEIETSFHRRVARSPITIQKKPFVPVKNNYLLTYLLTPWSRVLLEKLTGCSLSRNSPRFMEPEGLLPHSQASATCPYPEPAQSSPHTHFPKIRLNIILPSKPGSPQWSPSLRFPHQNPVRPSLLPHTRYMPRPSHSSRFYHPHNIGWGLQINQLLIM